jgi:hypothetical protein
MSGSRGMAAQLGDTGQAAVRPDRSSPVLGRWAVAGISACLLVMIAVSALRPSWQPQTLIMPVAGPPWELTAHVSAKAIVVALWLGALLGASGIIAGLVAVRRGQPVPIRTLLIAAGTAVAALVLLPPVGSTDSLVYAVYGHIVAIGHSPYVMTPSQYRHVTHLRYSAPLDSAGKPSYYGPLATAEQFVAAKLAGSNIARTVLWLKLFNALAFASIAVAADRRFHGDRAGRLRAHLLWTANPLAIWALIAAAHLDVLAAAVGVAGLLLADERLLAIRGGAHKQSRRPWLWALAAGACVGAAADIKIDYALFALAIAWALRRRPRQLLIAAAGALALLVPSYAIAGWPAIKALSTRVSAGKSWEYWPVVDRLIPLHLVLPIAGGLMIPLAALALARMPMGFTVPSAVRAALAFSLAWLLVWPHQFGWYSVMVICVLVFYPASRLDWVAVAMFIGLSFSTLPGLADASKVLGNSLHRVDIWIGVRLGPAVLFCAFAAFVILCITHRWQVRGSAWRLARSKLLSWRAAWAARG